MITSILIIVSSAILLYIYLKSNYSYWKNRNVYTLEPTFFYGNIKDVVINDAPFMEVTQRIYDASKKLGNRYGGFYSFFSPFFVPVDIELIKETFQTNFVNFVNRGRYVNEKVDPLSGHLVGLGDQKWKNLRVKLTPAFSSGKMKMMFETMVECGKYLQKIVNKSAHEPVDIKEIVSRYTTDIVASVGFGIECNSLENPDCDFRKFGNEAVVKTPGVKMALLLILLLPTWVIKLLRLKTFTKEAENFFINTVKDTVAYREKNNIYRKDFLHLLIQLKNMGQVSNDDDDNTLMLKNKQSMEGMTLNQMAAQSFVFLIAGFETSATTITYALLELSQNENLQDDVRDEINRVLKKYDNKLTYEAVSEMELLDRIIDETLRKHPSVPVINRICTKDYKVPNSDLVIKRGTMVIIPVFSVHRDPDYYPDPEKFDPDRFSKQNKAARPSCAFIPFGEGPRMCIGLRFGKLQVKVGLCSLLTNYRMTLNEKTKLPIEYTSGTVMSVKGGIWLNLEPVQSS